MKTKDRPYSLEGSWSLLLWVRPNTHIKAQPGDAKESLTLNKFTFLKCVFATVIAN